MKVFQKNILNSIFKRFFLILILMVLYTIICASSYVSAISSDLSSSVFRLHVIANSNSSEDQSLKYKVRDSVLEYINNFANIETSKDDIISFTKSNIDTIKSIAQNTIYENGYNYSVNISIGNFAFPTKTYGDISFPSGFYDALKIEIGNAEGKNWWCVMFPPLCFVDVTSGIVPEDSKETLKNNLSSEEYSLLSENSSDINLKFKIIEMFQNIHIELGKLL